MEELKEKDLESVAGGAGGAQKHVKIIGCKHCCNVRSSAKDLGEANKLGHAYLGDRYLFYGWSGNWAKVQYGSVRAYIYKDFIEIV